MSQYDWGTMDGSKSGIALATDLNAWRTAVNSSHRGVTEPTYKVVGTRWVDSSLPNERIKIWDGIQWLIEVEIDVVNNRAIYGNGARIILPQTSTSTSAIPGEMWIENWGYLFLANTIGRRGGPNEWETISHSATTTAAAAISFTGMAYRQVRVRLECSPAVDAATLRLRFSTDNGSTYDTNAFRYEFMTLSQETAQYMNMWGGASLYDCINLCGSYVGDQQGNAAGENLACEIEMHDLNQSRPTVINARVTGMTAAGKRFRNSMTGYYMNSVSTNAFQFSFNNGNIAHSWYLTEVMAA